MLVTKKTWYRNKAFFKENKDITNVKKKMIYELFNLIQFWITN